MLTTIGELKYFDDELKINVMIEEDLIDYYRSLVPKYVKLNKTKFPGHITVVRNEKIYNPGVWRKYQGKNIVFEYGEITPGDVYWWLPVRCRELVELRMEMGLPPCTELTKPPTGRECFHITIGNTK